MLLLMYLCNHLQIQNILHSISLLNKILYSHELVFYLLISYSHYSLILSIRLQNLVQISYF